MATALSLKVSKNLNGPNAGTIEVGAKFAPTEVVKDQVVRMYYGTATVPFAEDKANGALWAYAHDVPSHHFGGDDPPQDAKFRFEAVAVVAAVSATPPAGTPPTGASTAAPAAAPTGAAATAPPATAAPVTTGAPATVGTPATPVTSPVQPASTTTFTVDVHGSVHRFIENRRSFRRT